MARSRPRGNSKALGLRQVAAVVAALTWGGLAVVSAEAGPVKDRPGDVRVDGTCSGGATAKLRLRARHGAIELEFEVEHARPGAAWRAAIVHERRVVWKGVARTSRTGGSFELRRALPDLVGSDTVTVRAWGPGGVTCRATTTLATS